MTQYPEYDGVGSLDDVLANGLKLCSRKSNNALSKHKRDALEALGIKITSTLGGIENAPIRKQIYDYWRNKLESENQTNALQVTHNESVTGNTQSQSETTENDTTTKALPITQKRNKPKRAERFDKLTRISFSVTGNAQRQHISLEPEYMKALELIAPTNRNQWLGDTVADYIAKNGVESSTRIIKCSIVTALIERIS